MKKSILAGMAITAVLLTALIVAIINAYSADSFKKNDADKVSSSTALVSDSISEKAAADIDKESDADIIESVRFRLEILSAQRYDTLYDFEEYNDNYLFYEYHPNKEPDIYINEKVDEDALKEAYPEYAWLDEHWDEVQDGEAERILAEADRLAEEQYTVRQDEKNDYIFVKCRYTNKLDRTDEVFINDQQLVLSKENYENEWYMLTMVYFDKPQCNNDDKQYFIIDLDAGESIEYTIAVKIPEEYDDFQYYYGTPSVINDYDGNMQNPALQSRNMKKIMVEHE